MKPKSKSDAAYKVGDIKKSISKNQSTMLNEKKDHSTTYLKLAEMFSSSERSQEVNPPVDVPETKPKKRRPDKEETDRDESLEIHNGKSRKFHSKSKTDPDENRRTIFVGNLPKCYTRKQLGRLFKDEGTIESLRIRSVARSDPKLQRRLAAIKGDFHPDVDTVNAYIRFQKEESARSSLKMNGQVIDGFHIRVDMAGESQHDNKHSLFLGNLHFKIDEEKVRKHFQECGEIISVRIVRDRLTRMGKGFGYVTFRDRSGVEFGLKLNESELEGRPLRVSRCQKDGAKSDKKNHNHKRTRIASNTKFQAVRRITIKKDKRKKLRNKMKF